MQTDQQTPETPELTEYQKWAATPTEEEETPADTAAAEKPAKVETTPPDSAPDDVQEDPEGEEEEKLPKGLKKRFRKLTAEIRELKSRQATPPAVPEQRVAPQAEAKREEPAGKPVAEKFETYEEYIEALTDWKQDQREARRAQEEMQRKRQDAWKARVEAAKAEHEDFDEVLTEAATLPISPHMHDLIVDSEDGPRLAYYLAQHPDETKRIASLPPIAAARELGKIEAKLSSQPAAGTPAPEKPKPAVSKAPKPPALVNGRAPADAGKEPDPKDFKAWSKWKDRQEALAEA